MKKSFTLALIIIALAATSISISLAQETQTVEITKITNSALTTEQIQDVIGAGVEWFDYAQERNGHFRYEYMPFLDRYIDDDNMVRQTGALYELGEIFARDTEDKYDIQKTLEKSISYFEENSIDGEFNGREFRCILKTKSKCSLGAASLALIGVIDLVEKEPKLEKEYKDLIEGYKNFILAMRNDGKGFRGNYYLEKDQNEKESTFSNGEAFFALARYYRYNPTTEVKKIIDDSFEYFVEQYGQAHNHDNNFYLWGMAAVKDLYELEQKKEYYDFAKTYTDWRIAGYENKRSRTHNYCAYIEGVISAYSVIEPNITEEDREFYLEEINFWLTKMTELQVTEEDILTIRYNYTGTKELDIEEPDKAVGGFLTDLNEPVQRIDFTQHCLSSYLQKLVDIDEEEL